MDVHGVAWGANEQVHQYVGKRLRIAAARAALLVVLSVWASPVAWCAQSPEVLSSGVRSDQGALAWSLDGKWLAYITKRVELHNFETRKTAVIKADNPFFVNWSSSGNLLILHGREGHRALAVVETGKLSMKSFPLGVEADGVYPFSGPDTAVVTSSSVEKSPNGASFNYKLFIFNIRSGALVKRFELSRPLPASDTGMASLTGWMLGGLHPLEFSAVLFEFVHPPKHNPYMKLATVSPDTGLESEIYRAQEGAAFVPYGSFSPSGRQMVLTTTAGRLRILSTEGTVEAPDDSFEGFHPSWSPGGGWIYTGGVLVSVKGKPSRTLLRNASRSVAQWRPDGNLLAVSSAGRLWVFETAGIDAPPMSVQTLKELRNKVKLLHELLAEDFLDEEEYTMRYNSLLNRYGY